MKFHDMTGQRFGRLTVVGRSDSQAHRGEAMWECVCECGGRITVRGSRLRQGQVKSCGCWTGGRPLIDLTGQRFGRLLVVERSGGTYLRADGTGTAPRWVCRCDCGAEVTRLGSSLRDGLSDSCGCLRAERSSATKRSREPGYSSLHKRLAGERGPACGFLCVECGADAEGWAWTHRISDDTRWAADGRGYSLNAEDYAPMCVSCHRRFDVSAARDLQPHRKLHSNAAEVLGLSQDQYRKLLRQNRLEALAALAGWVPVFYPDALAKAGVVDAVQL